MHTKTLSALLLIATLTGSTACHKNTGSSGALLGPVPLLTVLYTSNDTLEYLEGSSTTILGKFPNSSANLNAMAVRGSNVYVNGGYLSISDSMVGEVWDNGRVSRLMDTAGNDANVQTTAIFVDGTDVYIGGTTQYPLKWTVPYTTPTAPYPIAGNIATWWKNGIAANLPDPAYIGTAYGYGTSSHDEYVSGIAIDLPPLAPYDTASNGGVENVTNTTGIFVAGNDVYVCGWQASATGASQPIYWKNGVPLPLFNTGEHGLTAGIFVTGNDVYVTGDIASPSVGHAVYWKNGVATTLSSNPSGGNAIVVSGSNVYVAGYETINGVYYATWWKNGVATHLGTGGQAWGIAVP